MTIYKDKPYLLVWGKCMHCHWGCIFHGFSWFFLVFFENRRRGLARLLKLYKVFILTKKRGNNPRKYWGHPLTPEGLFFRFLFFLKSLKFLKLWIWVLSSWGRCMKAILQPRAPENFRSCWFGAERRVSRAQTRERGPPSAWAEILYFSTLVVVVLVGPLLAYTPEGIVVGL